MRRLFGLLVVSAAGLFGCAETRIEQRQSLAVTPAAPPRLLRQVMLIRFKPDTTTEDILAVERLARQLPLRVPALRGFEWGTDVSVENRSEGFTHCYLMTFGSPDDRAAYLAHPAYRELMDRARPHIDRLIVVDYWARE